MRFHKLLCVFTMTKLHVFVLNVLLPGGGNTSLHLSTVQVNKSITSINMWYNQLGPQGGIAFAEMLKVGAYT